MDRPDLTEALEAELVAEPRKPGPSRAEDLAFAASATALIGGLQSLIPAGGVVAAVLVADVARRRIAAERPEVPDVSHVLEEVDGVLAARSLTPTQPEFDEATRRWNEWLSWPELCAGEHIDVPADMPHPTCAGFEFTRLASRVGQAADWIHPLIDGSRLHAHEYRDGRLTVHRDALDPERNAPMAMIHWMSETPEGLGVAALLAAGLVTLGWMSVDR